MSIVFIRISELKSNSYKKAYNYSYSNKGTKTLKKIIGVNPLNKEWIEEAIYKFRLANQNQGVAKIKYQISSLELLYFCDWVLRNYNYSDNEIYQLIDKVETSYINSCLSFIESHVHDSHLIFKSYSSLVVAVSVLNEFNSVMAQKYQQMLSRYQSVYYAYEKINEIYEVSNNEFTVNNASQLFKIFTLNSTGFKMYPELKEQISELISYKVESLYLDAVNNLNKLYNRKENTALKFSRTSHLQIILKNDIALSEVTEVYSNFYKVYKALENVLNTNKYDDFIDEYLQLKQVDEVLSVDYQEWLNLYKYYSLPRKQIDNKKILNALKSINLHRDLFQQPFKEIKQLDPSPNTILKFLEQLIDNQENDSIISYYKIENDLLNAKDTPEKIDEIIKFISFLNIKIFDYNKTSLDSDSKLLLELQEMRSSFLEILDSSIENQISKFLYETTNIRKIKDFFDTLLDKLNILNDLSRISDLRVKKKQILKVLNVIPELFEGLKNDIEYYNKLPETTAKDGLKDKIFKNYDEINKLIPIMILYKFGNVEEYIGKLNDFENIISSFSKKNKETTEYNPQYSRLIILDRFSLKNIIVFVHNSISIGRNESQNDILLNSEWVSGTHGVIDFKLKEIIDLESTNGTYINQEHIQIDKINLQEVSTFNIAEAFEFSIVRHKGFFVFKIIKVFDSDLVKNNLEYVQSLFNTEFVWVEDECEFIIDAYSGTIKDIYEGCKINETDMIVKKLVKNEQNQFKISDSKNTVVYDKLSTDNEVISDRFSVYFS